MFSPAYTWFFLAMTHHRLGHAEEARQWLEKAVNWTKKETEGKIEGAAPLSWNRRLTLEILRREAEQLIGTEIKKKSKALLGTDEQTPRERLTVPPRVVK